VAGCCECGHEHSSSITCREFLELSRNSRVLAVPAIVKRGTVAPSVARRTVLMGLYIGRTISLLGDSQRCLHVAGKRLG
jgi:hypothetical protein